MKTTAINTSVFPILRFFAASIVVFFHFGQKIEYYQQVPVIFKAGPQMVTFFFVLSGFVLFLGYQGRELVFRQYFLKRAIKILPLYFLAFLMSVVFRTLSGHLSFAEFLLNLLCLQSWFPHPLSLNFTSWFVSDLLFFYCVFPPILFVLKKTRPDGWKMVTVGLLFWALTQGVLVKLLNTDFHGGYFSSYDLILYSPLSHFCSFFMGICGAYFIQNNGVGRQQGATMSLLLSLFILCAVGLMVQFQPQLSELAGCKLPFASSFYAPVVLLVLCHMSLSRNPLLRILLWPNFVLWGEISYALYILQAPMDTLYKYIVPEHLGVQPGMNFFMFFILLVATAFLVTWVEKIIIRRLRIIA
ncbi:MAG: acyltransferase [Proteobacteria bacterium]|nr:acyltransferase [Desulfocapsa sp.]MBU3946231.1 acyltransferase [Pseudomonadota bacterium]MCG2745373.1 acyltransferase [Desulfobacteraceae bacterium]MBU3984334.1 acyltransferase [Pseudomonadota bacterium]MBU4027854.1 acyltransferase [Pseudomonadota bacterium]